MTETDILPFDFKGAPVRVVLLNGAPHWVAADVASVLGYDRATPMVRMLEPHQKGVHKVDTLGGQQEFLVVTEGGLFRCIMRSKKPEAKAFSLWVEEVLLPAIRRNGRFEMEMPAPAQSIDEPGLPEFAERVRVGLQLVREARIVFGRDAARRAWVIAGLPDLSETVLPPALSNADQRQVAAWFGENVEPETGGREGATRLYMDYARWCNEGDEAPVSIRRFADSLKLLGVDKITSNGVQYLDIRLNTG